LTEWKGSVGLGDPPDLSRQQIDNLGRVLEPKSAVAVDGSIRRLAGYVNLELLTQKNERFRRAYKGSHPSRRDRVILYLYDLSADDRNAEAKARREFDALHRLQLSAWAPRILDSYQDAPGYAGEMYFFTLVDPAAPSLEVRTTDKSWTTTSRVEFARNAIRALVQLHQSGTVDYPVVHRNLTPRTILVKHDNSPLITSFERARIPAEVSVASSSLPVGPEMATAAPEVLTQGLAAADSRSDVYSLCRSLAHLFADSDDLLGRRTLDALQRGLADDPSRRATLKELDGALSELLGESVPPPAPPPARFWTEDQVVRFRERDYRIVTRLGSGGVGTAFKVVEVDRSTDEELGTYVAKVAHDESTGRRVLKAYSLVRSHLRHTALSTIFEVARDWHENDFIALLTWIEGTPLADFTGVFGLLAEDQQETSVEALALRWLVLICEALDVLHRNGLVHGDISPRNMIVSGSALVLTDYDFVSRIGEQVVSPGTVLYCSPSQEDKRLACPADDHFALAASFFHVIFEREPFRYGAELEKGRGLHWDGLDRTQFPTLADFLDRATHPDKSRRYESAAAAADAIRTGPVDKPLPPRPIPGGRPHADLREEHVHWLLNLLQSYPGSRWGNRETRGLDTPFAASTYVETSLERTLERDIRDRRVRLVILCGNAGDGKTALLQHLAGRLGLGKRPSSERILKGKLGDGLKVRMNLDGSAAWKGRSADELLDDFLSPFQDGPPAQDIIHLLAINDGRLLEWIESVEARRGGQQTPLSRELSELLQGQAASMGSHIRFVSLNERSLVGGVNPNRTLIETEFLDHLIDQLYGGEKAAAIWAPCQRCSARERCRVFEAMRVFGPAGIPDAAVPAIRTWALERLAEALQAVHLRGETHITVRELRAALVYILFGIHYCDDYHAASEDLPLPYWDRAFAADSPGRQGELLRETARFDPALDTHPHVDRYLTSRPVDGGTKTAPRYTGIAIESGRRRAYFEWTAEDLSQVAGDPHALDLAHGQHLREFRNLPLASDEDLADLCRRLCQGISRLEDLPPKALDRPGVVPLRVTPRTPTETAFWVEKPLNAFRLKPDLPPAVEGIERLHRQAYLSYRYHSGSEEQLLMGAELFHLLLELSDGYQLGDVSTDDTFANLSIFVQRLVREDERVLFAWNPMRDETIYRLSAEIREADTGPEQRIVLTPLSSGAQP
jgi:serine/threonine protein kinase